MSSVDLSDLLAKEKRSGRCYQNVFQAHRLENLANSSELKVAHFDQINQ